MDVNLFSLDDLFDRTIRYLVPSFQRRYVWNRDDQWELLWDDVLKCAAAGLASSEETDRPGKSGDDDHFLGALVIQQTTNPLSRIRAREVIDGQQRLVTLQLLLGATRDVLRGLDHSSAERLQRLVENNDPDVRSDPDQAFKVWPTSGDREAFRDVMAEPDQRAGAAPSRIAEAHRYFHDRVRGWLLEDPEHVGRRIAALEYAITSRLRMVVIELDEGDNPHVIFETLNARGTPLLNWDLTKNELMNRAKDDGINAEELANRHFGDFEDDWWDEEARLGTLRRSRIDAFLNSWLIFRTGKAVEAKEVFDALKIYAKSAGDVEELADDLRQLSIVFREIEETDDRDASEGLFLYRWKEMQARVFTPVLLALFSGRSDQRADRRDFQRGLRAIESYLVRRMLCGMTTRGYYDLVLPLLDWLAAAPPNQAGAAVAAFLAGQTGERHLWPGDQRLREAMLHVPVYERLSRGRARLVLEALEGGLRTEKSDAEPIRRKLSIEHVMPKQWREHWDDLPQASSADGDDPAAARDRIIHTIGNLTLVSKRLNPAMSNAPWADKRAALREHSSLFLNKDLLAHSRTRWNEAAISARGDRLWQAACAIWPSAERA